MKKLIKKILIYLYHKCDNNAFVYVCTDCEVNLKIDVEQCDNCQKCERWVYNL